MKPIVHSLPRRPTPRRTHDPRSSPILVSLAALACLFAAAAVPAARSDDDWPQLLGPRRDGVSTETGLNLEWKTNPPRTVWKKAPGAGFSSVAVVGDRLVTQAQRDGRQYVVCLAAKDGEELWAYDAAPAYIDRQHAGAGPRSTPTVAGDRVYCLFPRGELVCVSLAKGEEVWKTNIFDATKAKDHFQDFYYWGLSPSPLVEGDVVIVQPGGDKDNSVVAFNKDNGKVVWGVGSDPAGYGSPVAIDVGKKRMVVCPTGQSILGDRSDQGRAVMALIPSLTSPSHVRHAGLERGRAVRLGGLRHGLRRPGDRPGRRQVGRP